MDRLKVKATDEMLDNVLAFVDEFLEKLECPMREQMQLAVAVEEIFVNIAHYAYGDDVGDATIEIEENDRNVKITFYDSGMPYDPLAKEDPDITLSVEERPIGGLGIYMVKKSMDSVEYRHEDGMNIFSMTKKV